jgi:hypothetical protein
MLISRRPNTFRCGRTLSTPIQQGTPACTRYLVICTPAGFDDFVDACATARTAPLEPSIPTDADKARMRAAAERFGITLIKPATASC